jgi:CRISPR-associated endonuclease/helicase Cas3
VFIGCRATTLGKVRTTAPRQPSWHEEDLARLGEQLKSALADGGCAAVICNTVARAQEVHQAFKPFFPGDADDGLPQLDLFHARYPFEERDAREKRSLKRFGRPDDPNVKRPGTAVLVATQVIEQSLDLDFDLMVTFSPCTWG